MASTGECGGNAAALALAGTPKSGTARLWGWPGQLSGVSEKSVMYPPRTDELEGPRSSPLPHRVGRLWNLPAPPPYGGLAAAGARGACGGLHCVAAVRPRTPGLPPRGRGLRPSGPRGGWRSVRPRAGHPETGGGVPRGGSRVPGLAALTFLPLYTERRPKPVGHSASLRSPGRKQMKKVIANL